MQFLQRLKAWFGFGSVSRLTWQPTWTDILEQRVAFYRGLSADEKQIFEQRALLFLQTTSIEAGQIPVTDVDRVLVAASAIIPVWGFPDWHYFNVSKIFLLPAAFNERFECGMPDSCITGMVGTGPMAGKVAFSQPALIEGFSNERDKKNVGIHEFVHLVDMADGDIDGFPERLKKFRFAVPWFELVADKIKQIDRGKSNIRDYGATNDAEFLAVVSEYFFERPEMLKRKHPRLFEALSDFYQQDVSHIKNSVSIRKKAPCPCGSGKRYKRCCMTSEIPS